MKVLPLKLSLDGLTLDAEAKNLSAEELVIRVLKNIILAYAQKNRGLQEEERRKYYKISDALEAAVKEKKESVDLEDDWFGFLKKCKSECQLFPDTLLRRVEDLIDAVHNR